jgi:hypothetical protein
MYIQYVGFNVAASSRVYNFDVIDTDEAREFTVEVQSGAFRPAALKLQDGPGICLSALEAGTARRNARSARCGPLEYQHQGAGHPGIPGTALPAQAVVRPKDWG